VTDTSSLARRVAGTCSLAASVVVLVSSFLTWLEGGSYCGTSVLIFTRANLWQLGLPLRRSWYSLALCFVVGGAVILAFVSVNEFGLPMLRWLDRWRWAPALMGSLLIATGAFGTRSPPVIPIVCFSSVAPGPGKWLSVAGSALGIIAVIAIVLSMHPRDQHHGDSAIAEFEERSDTPA